MATSLCPSRGRHWCHLHPTCPPAILLPCCRGWSRCLWPWVYGWPKAAYWPLYQPCTGCPTSEGLKIYACNLSKEKALGNFTYTLASQGHLLGLAGHLGTAETQGSKRQSGGWRWKSQFSILLWSPEMNTVTLFPVSSQLSSSPSENTPPPRHVPGNVSSCVGERELEMICWRWGWGGVGERQPQPWLFKNFFFFN